MGGRGSGSTGNAGIQSAGGLTDGEYDLISNSPQYGAYLTGTNDKSVYQYGAAQGLSTAETNLIHSYTFDLYKQLNADILDGKAGVTSFVTSKLNTALSKLPDHKGEVYRGISVDNPAAFAERLKRSGGFAFDSFTSTTTSRSKANEFTTKGKSVIFEIRSKRGKAVSKLSSQKDENEVLLKAGSRFKYVSSRTEGGVTVIKIIEQ